MDRLLRLMREATMELAGGESVYYQTSDPEDTLRDALDLYTVIPEDYRTGSESLENKQAMQFVAVLQSGGLLAEVDLGVFLGLLSKYRDEIAALRASPDREGQDHLAIDATPNARIIDHGS